MFIFNINYLIKRLILGFVIVVAVIIISSNVKANAIIGVQVTVPKVFVVPNLNNLARCEYFKYKVFNYCKKDHSSLHEERVDCATVYKQRWCVCMEKSNDCFREPGFIW